MKNTASNSPEEYSDRTIITLFNRQVIATPHHIALICNGEEFSYKELDDESNRVAQLSIT